MSDWLLDWTPASNVEALAWCRTIRTKLAVADYGDPPPIRDEGACDDCGRREQRYAYGSVVVCLPCVVSRKRAARAQ